MVRKPVSARVALDRLADALIEDILNASDEEILEEFREDGGDPEQHAKETQALIEKAVALANERQVVNIEGKGDCTWGGRWMVLSETSPSGKTMFQCLDCGRKSTTPDKRCPPSLPVATA